MELTKQQIKEVLNIFKRADGRLPLQHFAITKEFETTYLVATDSYILIAYELDNSFDDLVGKGITYDDLNKWYKLASTKDMFTSETIREFELVPVEYPKWQALIQDKLNPTETTSTMFNTELLTPITKLATNGTSCHVTFNGDMNPIDIKVTNNSGYAVIMPLKK